MVCLNCNYAGLEKGDNFCRKCGLDLKYTGIADKLKKLTPKELKALQEAYSVLYLNDSSDYRLALKNIVEVFLPGFIKEFDDFDNSNIMKIICPDR